jgi:hypothetical protein
MATSLSDDEIKKGVEALKEEARLREVINSSFNDFLSSVKDYKKVQKSILQTDIKIKKEQEIITDPKATLDQKKAAEVRLTILKKYNKELEIQNNLLAEGIADANKGQMALAKGAKVAADLIGSIPSFLKKSMADIRGLGLFEMDSAIKKSALSMGLLSSQSKTYSNDIRSAAMSTTELGIGVQELAKMQSDYSEEIGRSVMLNESGLKAMSAMAAATGLGAEGAAKMAADMEQQGLSAERTASFVEKAMQESSQMGLNASKVIKTMSKNIGLLNKYNFKDGIEGLKKMTEFTTKLGVDMKFAAPFADKLFDIEGAVDMSAQLQVMGGAWAKLADPFHLMYMARNDMAGLTEEIGKATESSVHFNAQKGDFEISAMEMHRLRVIAQQTGISYEELATAGKNAAKFTKIRGQMSVNIGDKDTKEFLENTAKFDENGRAYIELDIGGNRTKKFLDSMDSSSAALLKSQMNQNKTLEQYAKDSQTFDDSLKNLINMFKVTLLPIVDGLNEVLMPLVRNIFDNKEFKASLVDLGKNIGSFVKEGAEIVKWFAELAIWLGPKGTLYTIFGTKVLGWMIDKATWFTNGLQLAQGFNVGTTGKGGVLSNLMNWLKGGKGAAGEAAVAGETGFDALGSSMASGSISSLGKFVKGAGIAGAVGGGISGYEKYSEERGKGKGVGESLGKGALKGAGAFLGGAGGWALGAALAPETGGLSLLLPLLLSGGLSYAGGKLADTSTYGIDDGIVQGGKITPIDSKDDLLAMKPDGAIAKTLGAGKTIGGVNEVKHTFGDLTINGQLVVTTPGGGSVGTDLLKDPSFIRSMTLLVTNEVQKINNGGKNT